MSTTGEKKPCTNCGQTIVPRSPSGTPVSTTTGSVYCPGTNTGHTPAK